MIKQAICAAIALCVASAANAATLRLKNYMAPADEKQRILNAMYLDGLKDGLSLSTSFLPATAGRHCFACRLTWRLHPIRRTTF